MLLRLLRTNAQTNVGLGLLLVRLPVAVGMIMHGYGKVANIQGFINYCDSLGIPPLFAYFGAAGEFFGGLGLLLGCLSRIAGFGVACTMATAMVSRHLIPGYGYTMNWHGGVPFGAEGYEYHTLAIGMAASIMVIGAGKFSVDYLVAKMLDKSKATHSERVREAEPVGVH